MMVVDSDGYEENYELISSTHGIISNKIYKISAEKNTVFLVKLVQWRCYRTQNTAQNIIPMVPVPLSIDIDYKYPVSFLWSPFTFHNLSLLSLEQIGSYVNQ